jgi:hypothetical protein
MEERMFKEILLWMRLCDFILRLLATALVWVVSYIFLLYYPVLLLLNYKDQERDPIDLIRKCVVENKCPFGDSKRHIALERWVWRIKEKYGKDLAWPAWFIFIWTEGAVFIKKDLTDQGIVKFVIFAK